MSGALPGPVLGLFPRLDTVGGIQACGRVAWDAVRAASSAGAPPTLFCYGPEPARPWAGDGNLTPDYCARSQVEAIRLALSHRWEARTVLIWHLSLLKLLPFLRLRCATVVVALHGIEAWSRLPWPVRRTLARVDSFLAFSEHTWARFLEASGVASTAPHRILPLGIGSPAWISHPALGGPPAAVMVGRLARSEMYSKGHREMIAAWPLVLERCPEAQLWIVGDGDLRPELERWRDQVFSRVDAGRSGSDHVRFFGEVGDEERDGLISAARFLAMPSRGEGFGLAYIEAMRLGRPCLVSTVDAGREVVNPPEAGLAADPDDPVALASATCRLLGTGPEWQMWCRQARARYEANFTAAHFRHRLLAALCGPCT